MQSLSIVIPIKDELDNLRPLHKRLTQAVGSLGRTMNCCSSTMVFLMVP